jgi:tetratricopeptide (TPR) repeat protein
VKKFVLGIAAVFIALSSYCQVASNDKGDKSYVLIEAARLKMLGNLEEAIKLYNVVLNVDPNCAAAHYELASLYSVIGKMPEAEKHIAQAFESDNENYWYTVAFIDVMLTNNKFDQAIEILKKSYKIFPQYELNFRMQLAQSYFGNENFRKALKEYKNIETSFGPTEATLLGKIEVFKAQNKIRNIKEAYEEALRTYPENIPILLMYADYLLQINDKSQVIKLYERVLNLDQGNIYAIINLAEIYAGLGDKEKTYKFLLEAFQSDKMSSEKKLQSLAFLLNDEERVNADKDYLEILFNTLLIEDPDNYELLIIGYDFFYKTGKYTESFEIIKKIISLRSDNYIMWAQTIYNASILSDYEAIIEYGNKALLVFPNKDDIRVYLGFAYFQLEMYDDSYSILNKTEDRFNEPDLKKQKDLLMAEICYKTGFVDEAFVRFEELLITDYDNLYIKNNYGYYLSLENRNLQRAKELSFETILREPENPTFLDTYGWILFKMGEFSEAESYLRRAVEFSEEDNPEILQHFYEVLLTNNKIAEAENIKLKLNGE